MFVRLFLASLFFEGHGDHEDLHSFPYTTLFRSRGHRAGPERVRATCNVQRCRGAETRTSPILRDPDGPGHVRGRLRSEEHTSELQSHSDLVCRLLLEKKKTDNERTGDNERTPPA